MIEEAEAELAWGRQGKGAAHSTCCKSRPKTGSKGRRKRWCKEGQDECEWGRGCSKQHTCLSRGLVDGEVEGAFGEEADAEIAEAQGLPLDSSLSAKVHVPGSAAKPVDILSLWSSMLRWVLRSNTDFACFLHIYLRDPLSAEESTALPFWPIPAPYPGVWKSTAAEPVPGQPSCAKRRRAEMKILNLILLVLSWLRLGSPRKPPKGYRLGLRCAAAQMKVVHRLESFVVDISGCGIVGPAEMGRSAAKMEGLDSILRSLHESTLDSMPAAAYAKTSAAARGVSSSSSLRSGSDALAVGEVIGSMHQGTPVVAKEVEPERLSLPKERPAFDPTPFLEEPHLSVYKDPIASAVAPACSLESPPRVRVHTKKGKQLEFLRFLDSHHRLALATEAEVRATHLCGAFALIKDTEKDRLILDARAPNLLEETLHAWCSTLGASQSLAQLELRDGCNMLFSGTDLQDYYHCFKVSRARSLRNALACTLTPQQASSLSCFSEKLWNHKRLSLPHFFGYGGQSGC